MLVPCDRISDSSATGRRSRVAIFGATGSIGRSALELIQQNPDRFEVVALVAGRKALDLHRIAEICKPRYVALYDPQANLTLRGLPPIPGVQIVDPKDASPLAALPEVDVVLAGIVGVAGLGCVEQGLRAGKRIALANKESLVVAGPLVEGLQRMHGSLILPVDSEHSALFQVLQGQNRADVESLVLTASGGPFRETDPASFSSITPAQAVKHPRWAMGAKISIDSATMMNKALEMIEARWLFGFGESQLEVVIHPQSIVHSFVRYADGTLLAHLSNPDMKGPISYALGYPHSRVKGAVPQLDLAVIKTLEFFEVDDRRFPSVRLARECLRAGQNACVVLNVANELAVEAFMDGRLRFDQIVPFVRRGVEREVGPFPGSFAELYEYLNALTERLRAQL